MRSNVLSSIVALLLAAGCAPTGTGGEFLPVENREDLSRAVFYTNINQGLSDPIEIDVAEGTMSLLIELKADKGAFSLAELFEPGPDGMPKSDVAESGVVTRGSRTMGGSANWLYPNVPSRPVKPGKYRLTIRGKDGDGPDAHNLESMRVEVTVYAKKTLPNDTCLINLDFVIDSHAIGGYKEVAEAVAKEVDAIYRPYGIGIGYSVEEIDLTAGAEIAIGDDDARLYIDDLVNKARHDQTNQFGEVFQDGMIVAMVNTIAGAAKIAEGENTPLGYSVGLPGPYANDRATSAILVSASSFAETGFLDPEGVGPTLAHEVGHYLGLLHPSEPPDNMGNFPDRHDPIADTLECRDPVSRCSGDFEKNVMVSTAWVTGDPNDRRVISPGQLQVIKGHPLCAPADVEMAPPSTDPTVPACDLACTRPDVCSIVAGDKACRRGCVPTDEVPCEQGDCFTDDLGTFTCH